MVLTIHHLGRSQSERIVWLCEELNLDYELKVYERSPLLAPPELKKLHPSETAPVLTDGDITLGESAAIAEYILTKFGHGRLQLKADDEHYADYLYWFHYANGTLQAWVSRNMFMRMAKLPEDNQAVKFVEGRREHAIQQLEDRLRDNEWLAGRDFTAADIMNVVSLTTMRLFSPYSLEKYPNILRYLWRVGAREGYRKAMVKGDPGFEPLLGAEKPKGLL